MRPLRVLGKPLPLHGSATSPRHRSSVRASTTIGFFCRSLSLLPRPPAWPTIERICCRPTTHSELEEGGGDKDEGDDTKEAGAEAEGRAAGAVLPPACGKHTHTLNLGNVCDVATHTFVD